MEDRTIDGSASLKDQENTLNFARHIDRNVFVHLVSLQSLVLSPELVLNFQAPRGGIYQHR